MTIFYASTAQLGRIDGKIIPAIQQPLENESLVEAEEDATQQNQIAERLSTPARMTSTPSSTPQHHQQQQQQQQQNTPMSNRSRASSTQDAQGYYGTISPAMMAPQLPRSPHAATPSVVSERNAIVKSLFGSTVGSCIAEFAVTYNRVMGRLFVASHAILYHCNLFGFERRLCLQLRDITQIETYRSTSVRISMVDCEDYIFKKFADRENVAKWLKQVLLAYRIQYPTEDLSFASHTGAADSSMSEMQAPNGSRSSHHAPPGRPYLLSDMGLHLDSSAAPPARPRSQSVPILIRSASLSTPTPPPSSFRRSSRTNSAASGVVAPLSPHSSASEDEHELAEEVDVKASGDMQSSEALEKAWQAVQVRYEEISLDSFDLSGCTLDAFYRLFLSDRAPHSIMKYQRDVIGDKNIQVTKWQEQKQQSLQPPTVQVRDIQFDHPLSNSFGPSHAKTTRKQKLQRFGKLGLVLENRTQVQGVPAADCFHLEDRWVIAACNNNDGDQDENAPHERKPKLTLTVSFKIVFTKRSLLKSLIQRNVRQETKKWFQGYGTTVRNALNRQDATRNSKADVSIASIESADIQTSDMESVAEPQPLALSNQFDMAKCCFLVLFMMLVLQIFQMKQSLSSLERQVGTLVSQNERLISIFEQVGTAYMERQNLDATI